MPLSKQHLKRNPEERNLGKGANRATVEAQFNRADMLLQEVVADITNGLTRNDIILKFANKQYEWQKKKIGEAQAKNYIKMAYMVMAEDRVQEQDKLRDQLYSQYLMLFNDLVVNGNTFGAKSVLDSISRIFLPDEKNIKLDANIDGELELNFNFNEDES